jgi:hypothetical protein
VIAREIEDVGAVTARERPDVALGGLGESSEHALGLIEKIVQEAACPVIVLIHAPDPGYASAALRPWPDPAEAVAPHSAPAAPPSRDAPRSLDQRE